MNTDLALIASKEFWKVYKNPLLNIFEIYWQTPEGAQELSLEEFKHYLLEMVDLIKQHRVSGFIIDARKYHVVMSVDFQHWHDTVIIPQYVSNGIKNIVFILSEAALFEAVSINQTFEEQHASSIKTQYKDSLEAAREVFEKLS